MLTDKDITFAYDGNPGIPLVWVIDTDCVYDLPLSKEHADIFLTHDEVIEITEQYPNHEGITVRFLKDGNVLEELHTTEYFGSILLSNPQVLNLKDYPFGRYVESPNAKFIDGQFVITNRDVTGMMP
jgi:hypothetical protein